MARGFPDASLATVEELVRWHLPARALVRFKLVSKEWRTWVEENVEQLAKVRRRTTVSRDWYFPLTFNEANWIKMLAPWSRVHHCGEEKLLKVHTLSNFNFLPRWPVWSPDGVLDSDYESDSDSDAEVEVSMVRNYAVLSVSGGLFLFKYKRKRLVPYLTVVNPLTREYRTLPHRGACCELLATSGAYGESAVRSHIVVDEEARTHTVTILTRQCFNVYYSQTNRWECSSKRILWITGFLVRDVNSYELPVSAIVIGRVFVCRRGQFPGRLLTLQNHHLWASPTRFLVVTNVGNYKSVTKV